MSQATDSDFLKPLLTRLMPKKRIPTYNTKPSSPAHPSLSSSTSKHRDAPRSVGSGAPSTGNAVNDRLQELRVSQRSKPSPGSQSASDVLNLGATPSLPPSLRSILQIPDAPPPRPRPNLRVLGRLRNPAGPAAPASWLRRNEGRTRGRKARIPANQDGIAFRMESLPGSYLPEDGSLVATSLKAIAKNWDWHKVYDQYYLPTILIRYKEALLHYIAQYSDHGIDRAGLELLFQDDFDLEDATGAEGLTHLDLATSIGYPLKFSDLLHLLVMKETAGLPDVEWDAAPESWDDSVSVQRGPSAGLFDCLTHLSLAHPNSAVTWKGLLDFAPHLATITHLSLAYWPAPAMSPNSKTAYRETPQGTVNYGASHFYSSLDQDWSEAVLALRRLSKSTYCLQWLDLTGCHPWIQALADPGIDWFASWRALETVKIGQGWLPECFQPGADELSWENIYYRHKSIEKDDNTQAGARQRLIEWADIERNSLNVEGSVNEGIGALTKPITIAGQELALGAMHAFASQRGLNADDLRTSKVRFERGWDAWWIKDAAERMSFGD